MRLAPVAAKFLKALEAIGPMASYAEIAELAGLTPAEVEAAYRDLVRAGCIELRPHITNRGHAAMAA